MKTSKEEIMKRFICVDCGINTHEINEYYMVYDEVWLSVVDRKHSGMLCISCLESRLGRKLNKTDFPPFPINNLLLNKVSPLLRNRISSFP